MMTRNELFSLLAEPNMAEILLAKSQAEVEELLGKECGRMVGFAQRNPHHCYALFEHCVRTAAGIELKGESDLLLRAAALFHDVGKPLVAKEKAGRLVFYGHAEESAKLMQRILPQFGFSEEECFNILFWIQHHDDFICYTNEKKKTIHGGRIFISEPSIKRYLAQLRKQYKELTAAELSVFLRGLMRLCKADARAQSENVYMWGKLVDTRADKVQRLDNIADLLCQELLGK